MEIDADLCYRALVSRDARFDGRFFTGVLTTGVYCRPVCPARTPLRRNCTFFGSAAAAAAAGFRPCLRCRPESSPGTPAWAGTSATVTRALRLIGEGVLEEGDVGQLATRLGMGERQLRRLFVEHLGAAPTAVEQTRRVHFAKKLLDETDLPITQIAFSAGFGSVRRFNGAMHRIYGRSPRELRRHGEAAASGAAIRLRLGYRPPLDWHAVLAFLAPRAIPGVEVVTGEAYLRSVAIGAYRGVIRVTAGTGDFLVLETDAAAAAELPRIVARVRAMFDLGADPQRIEDHLAADPRLRALVLRRPGLRLPGTWDGFELAVRAVLGQQVTVRGATTLAGRLAAQYGEPLDSGLAGIDRLFPLPRALVGFSGRGMPAQRGETIRELARRAATDASLFAAGRDLDAFVAELSDIPGLGPWTAHYVAMRALGEPDAFPASDLGLRRAIAAVEGTETPSPAALQQRAEAWRPWRSYAAMHLWTCLADEGARGGGRGARVGGCGPGPAVY
jgi:AraC family transcriptional regulator, regulatory protein of adaptative response / DNA-3-methyladenine glycosylase II